MRLFQLTFPAFYANMYAQFLLVLLLPLSIYSQDNLDSTALYIVTIEDELLQSRLDSVYQLLVDSGRTQSKGYLRVHKPYDQDELDQNCECLTFQIGWLNSNPHSSARYHAGPTYFSYNKVYGQVFEEGVLNHFDHTLIGKVELVDSFLDYLIQPDRELYLRNEQGDTTHYNPSWRPASLYIHPSHDFTICKSIRP